MVDLPHEPAFFRLPCGHLFPMDDPVPDPCPGCEYANSPQTCGRCAVCLLGRGMESCFLCGGPLCPTCWDTHPGHCRSHDHDAGRVRSQPER